MRGSEGNRFSIGLTWPARVSALLGLFLLLIPAAWAQIPGVNDQTATPTAGVGHNYIHMLNETVNPANGSVSLRINVPMPKGRGVTLPFSFVYNSGGLWAPASGLPNEGPSFGSNLNDSTSSTFYTENGWSYSLPLISMLGLNVGPASNPPNQNCPVETNFVFQDTSGGSYSLVGMFSVDYNYEQPGPLFPCGRGGNGSTTGGTDFYSASVDSFQGNISVVDADGTKYSFPSPADNLRGGCFTSPGSLAVTTQIYPLSVEDRNGNMINFSAPQGCNGPVTETDTAGRPVLSSSGFGTSGNTVTVDGLSPYTITWGTTAENANLGSALTGQDPACAPTINNTHGTLSVIKAITLPNGQKYQFSYDSVTGLLSQITYPTGGYVSYTWTANTKSEFAVLSDTSGDPDVCPYTYDTYAVSQRTVSFDGSTVALQQNFAYTTTWNSGNSAWTTKTATVTTHDLIQGITYNTQYTYSPLNAPTFEDNFLTDNVAPQVAMEQTIVYDDPTGHALKTVRKTWADLYELANEQTTLDNGMTSEVAYTYGAGGQVTEKDEYDFGLSLARKTLTTYQIFPTGGILDKPCTILVKDGSNNLDAETDYLYDGGSTACGTAGTPATQGAGTPSGTHDETNYGPTSSTPRGNATKIIRKCLFGCSTDSSTTYTYDETGQVLTMTDPCGNTTCSDMTGSTHTTTYSYTDNYSSCAGSAPPSGNTNAYLTQIKNPLGQIETYCYGYSDGQLRGATDPNNQTTTYQYVDSLARLTETDYPPGGGKTLVSYNDTAPTPSVTVSREITSGQYVTSTSVMNGVGLVTETELTSDPAGTDYTVTTYDGGGRAHTVSNPYRSTGDPTYGITTYTYDALGRTTQITHLPDGSKISTSYTGRATEVTDEGNGTKTVQRISQTDALGRLTSVCEVSSTTLLGASPTPSACGQDIGATGFLTSYSYNALGDLTGVAQGGLNPRTFAYDSLSRLTSSTNPESGTTCYGKLSGGICQQNGYDANGNLVAKADARGTATAYTYDVLNRLLSKTYSDGTTPSANFAYDASSEWGVTLTNPVGRLVLESADNNHAAAIFSYDPMGRTANEYQCTPLNCGSGAFPLVYTYDFLGDVQTSTNGEGVTFTQAFNTAAQLTTVTSSLSDASHPPTLLSNVAYNPLGALSSSTLGNGLNETLSYTNRAWLQSLTVTGTNLSDGNPATGSVTVGGSEKSTSGGTPGTGSVTISGTEQSTVINICQSPTKAASISPNNVCLKTVYDTGTVSITVNGVAESVGYGKGSTDSSIAAALALAFNNDSRSPVTATASGGTVSLTSKATGTSSNYPLSATSSTNDPTDFGGPSFTPSTSGTTLKGGTGGSIVYDSGTVSITVNGFAETVSYGNGSTTSSIAAALASAFNSASGSPVTATSGGGVVTLTSKTIGSSTDYTLSATSQTNNPGQFGSPSFTTSASGSTLTGGTGGYNVSLSYAPNGNVLGASDSANGNWTYSYDDFNRLVGASENGGQTVYNYAYDRFANRWQQSLTAGSGQTSNLTFSANNNRMDSYSYDASGNLLNDGMHTYTYDAESRIVSADGGAITYEYDAGGQRVRKTVGGASTDYVYDLAGHAIAEVNASGWQRGEVYAGGRHLATYANSTTYFDHGDGLGTERVRTAVNGSVCESITSLPFGDGMSTSGSCGDPSTRHFTGKQRDTETNLDDFDARYYSSQYGRFISADWSAVPAPVPYANLTNPQTLNLYAIVHDNPETFADLDGHSYTAPTAGGGMDLTGVGSDDFNSTGGDIPAPLALFQQQAQAAQQAAEQAQNSSALKGPYIADLKSKEIAPLLGPNHKSSNSDVVGPNGECVDLTKKFSGMGDVSAKHQWYPGEKVSAGKDIKPGTAIASFDDKGRFPSESGWNSGIYLGRGVNGSIWILDQWPGHTPAPRELLLNKNALPANNSAAYSVILTGPWR